MSKIRVFLSRKSFDSANGGISNVIMPNGAMLPFPIPSSDVKTFGDLMYAGLRYNEILPALKYKGPMNCHIDPDLDHSRHVNAIEGWVAAFGQRGAAASYLMKTAGIKVGDVFFFFGTFHFVEKINGTYRYTKKTGDFYKDHDIQVIYGYMQVGKIITDPEEQKKYYWHPHAIAARTEDGSNVIFVAAERLSFAPDMPGAGLLPFSEHRVLTAPGCNKATWKYNDVYDVHNVIGNRKNSSKIPNTIYYSGIWQEMGLEISDECEEWMKYIILGGSK